MFILGGVAALLPLEIYLGHVVGFRVDAFVVGFLYSKQFSKLVWPFHAQKNQKAGGRSKSKRQAGCVFRVA
jgi:hypothetical protein